MMQVELGEEIETRLQAAARDIGASVDEYVRLRIEPLLPKKLTAEELAGRRESVQAMRTFARDHGFTLPPGVTIKDLIDESRR